MSEAAPAEIDADLRRDVASFAEDVHRVLSEVLPTEVAPLAATARTGHQPHVVIEQGDAEGLALTVSNEALLKLRLKFWCSWDSAGRYLAVRQSEIQVHSVVSDTPLFRYDYVADARGNTPAAHLNIHGHRDEIVFAMLGAGRTRRGKTRDHAVAKGKVPRVASLHFPLGGHRFRPCLEDVLEFLITEFGLDTRGSWREAISRSRLTWRERQLKAAVRDDPESAAAALRAIGYSVDAPDDPPEKRLDRLRAF